MYTKIIYNWCTCTTKLIKNTINWVILDVVLSSYFGLFGASHESNKIKHAKIKQTRKSVIVYGNEPLQIVIKKRVHNPDIKIPPSANYR